MLVAACSSSSGEAGQHTVAISELRSMFTVFADDGFAPFADEWSRAHILDNAPAVLKHDSDEEHGTVHGVDADGALLFETGGELRRVFAGENFRSVAVVGIIPVCIFKKPLRRPVIVFVDNFRI